MLLSRASSASPPAGKRRAAQCRHRGRAIAGRQRVGRRHQAVQRQLRRHPFRHSQRVPHLDPALEQLLLGDRRNVGPARALIQLAGDVDHRRRGPRRLDRPAIGAPAVGEGILREVYRRHVHVEIGTAERVRRQRRLLGHERREAAGAGGQAQHEHQCERLHGVSSSAAQRGRGRADRLTRPASNPRDTAARSRRSWRCCGRARHGRPAGCPASCAPATRPTARRPGCACPG